MQSTKQAKTSAPYGQACLHCVKAKSRCILRDDNTCERSVGQYFIMFVNFGPDTTEVMSTARGHSIYTKTIPNMM